MTSINVWRAPAVARVDIVRGTLDLLILKTLSLEPRHGVGIAERIGQITNQTFQVKAGSLFPALHRLEQRGAIRGTWRKTEEGVRAKYYRLTPVGERLLVRETDKWRAVSAAMDAVLES